MFTLWSHYIKSAFRLRNNPSINILQLNTTKTKEMVVDFRRLRPHLQPVSIEGVCVEMVQTHRYLGLELDDRLDWSLKHGRPLQEGTEPTLLPEEAGVF